VDKILLRTAVPVSKEERFWLRVLFFIAVAACVILVVVVVGHYSIKILQWILVIANMKG